MLHGVHGAIRQDRAWAHVMEGLSVGGDDGVAGEDGSNGQKTDKGADGSEIGLQEVLETVHAV